MRKKIRNAFLFCLVQTLFSTPLLFAQQDDLLKKLEAETPPAPPQKMIATFKGEKIINIETNETVKRKNLNFRVNHQFGNIGKESGGGYHNLYGLDQSNDIEIGFLYGFTDRLMAGISRTKRRENLVGEVKFRLLEQTTDNKIPLAITFFADMTYSMVDASLVENTGKYRVTYLDELILARKFSSRLSVVLTPVYIHRNVVFVGDQNDVFAISGGFRMKFTQSASFILDYSHAFRTQPAKPSPQFIDPLGVGVEVETGGHVFTMMFSNANGILENDHIINTLDEWSKGGVKFSFIISRIFKMGKK